MIALFPKRILEKISFTGCSKTFRCKASEILRRKAYIEVRRTDKG